MSARIPRIQRLTWFFISRADRLLKIIRNIPWRQRWRVLRERIECLTWPGRMMPESSMPRQARLTEALRFFQPLNRMRERPILSDQDQAWKKEGGSGKPWAKTTMTERDL